jgi:CRISPR-associated protein (TIGR02584 family)
MGHHLLILLGLHPKVFTETLYALCVKGGVPVSKVSVISTASARQKTIETLLSPETGMYYRLCQEYPEHFAELQFSESSIWVASDGRAPVWDISNSGQSQAYLDLILSNINTITTNNECPLHAVVGGGRRTLSVYLAMAMQLLGREQDRLYHLVVHPWEIETHSDFYFPTRESRLMVTFSGNQFDAKDVSVDLVEIPFIRLRNRFPIGKLSARTGQHLVEWMQREINGALVLPELVVDKENLCLRIGPDIVCLQPQQFCLYWYFADLSRFRPKKVPADAYNRYFEASGSPYFSNGMLKGLTKRLDLLDSTGELRYRFATKVLEDGNLPMSWVLQKIARINERIRTQLSAAHLIPFYIISAVGKRGSKCYGIKLNGNKIVTPDLSP